MYIQVSGNGQTSYITTTPNSKPQETKSRTTPQKKDFPAKSQQQQPQPQQASTTHTAGDHLDCSPDADGAEGGNLNCDTCSRVMKGKMMLQAHKFQEHHVNPELENASIPTNKFPCRVCCKLFTRNSDVKAHILRVHCGDRRYPCNICGKR